MRQQKTSLNTYHYFRYGSIYFFTFFRDNRRDNLPLLLQNSKITIWNKMICIINRTTNEKLQKTYNLNFWGVFRTNYPSLVRTQSSNIDSYRIALSVILIAQLYVLDHSSSDPAYVRDRSTHFTRRGVQQARTAHDQIARHTCMHATVIQTRWNLRPIISNIHRREGHIVVREHLQSKRLKGLKGAYSSLYRKPIAQLRSVTSHMGSHSVTCHPDTDECAPP